MKPKGTYVVLVADGEIFRYSTRFKDAAEYDVRYDGPPLEKFKGTRNLFFRHDTEFDVQLEDTHDTLYVLHMEDGNEQATVSVALWHPEKDAKTPLYEKTIRPGEFAVADPVGFKDYVNVSVKVEEET